MTVTLDAPDRIRLAGPCPAEDAEMLLQHLLERPEAAIDWSACDTAHTAVVQVLIAARRRMIGPPRGSFLRQRVAPAIARANQFDLS